MIDLNDVHWDVERYTNIRLMWLTNCLKFKEWNIWNQSLMLLDSIVIAEKIAPAWSLSWLEAGLGWVRKKLWSRDLNPGRPGVEHKRYLCAMPIPLIFYLLVSVLKKTYSACRNKVPYLFLYLFKELKETIKSTLSQLNGGV